MGREGTGGDGRAAQVRGVGARIERAEGFFARPKKEEIKTRFRWKTLDAPSRRSPAPPFQHKLPHTRRRGQELRKGAGGARAAAARARAAPGRAGAPGAGGASIPAQNRSKYFFASQISVQKLDLETPKR